MRHLFFSWGIWQGFPVVSGPIRSAQTQTWIPRAYGPALDPRVCASGCVMHDCLHDAYRSFWKEAASKHSTTIWRGLTPHLGRSEAWEEERSVCLKVSSWVLADEWVEGLASFQEPILPALKPPKKTQTDLLPPPRLALGSSLAEGNALIKHGIGLTSPALTGMYCGLYTAVWEPLTFC